MLSVNAMTSLSNSKLSFQYYYSEKCSNKLLTPRKDLQIKASSSAAPDVDLKTLESAISKKDSDAIKEALDQLSEVGWAKKWSSQPYVSRRTKMKGLTFRFFASESLRELTTLGIKNAENLAIPSVRNDSGQQGFWEFLLASFLGLLQAAIGGFSSFFPDYQERIARHEAAYFLIGYLLGLPILGYSLDVGKEHVNLIDEKLEKLIYSGQLDAKELDRWAVVAMTGLAAEGLKYDNVVGQSADLFTLQRFINRSKPKLSNDQLQNLTRWAVLFAGSLLKNKKVTYEALMSVMSKKATVLECIEAIEKAA